MTLTTLKPRIACVGVLTSVLLLCSTASAEGWGLPSLNPFAKKSKAPTSARVSDGGSGFSLLPKWGSSTKKRSSGPSTWNRMTTGTKSLVSKTTSAINLWDNESKSTANSEPSPTGSFNPFSTASAKKQDAPKKSFLPSWTTNDEEEDGGPRSVNEFLSQEKLDP